ncbi:MAG: hypothetical protein NUV65_06860 [Candidatus Roizmanbacteria bacterium]|nr:hypothetical protein [Candidatus Roizmanbacteria bacterium]
MKSFSITALSNTGDKIDLEPIPHNGEQIDYEGEARELYHFLKHHVPSRTFDLLAFLVLKGIEEDFIEPAEIDERDPVFPSRCFG